MPRRGTVREWISVRAPMRGIGGVEVEFREVEPVRTDDSAEGLVVSDERVRALVRDALGGAQFDRYFARDARLDVVRGRLEVAASTSFIAGLIGRRFGAELRRAAHAAGIPDGEASVCIRVEAPAAASRAVGSGAGRGAGASERRAIARPEGRPRRAGPLARGSRLDEFVVGESNRLAYAAAVRIAELGDGGSLRLLFVHGRSGMGKTHLLEGVVERRRRLGGVGGGARPVRYTTAETFTNEFIAAVRGNRMDAFRRAWRGLGLLCIDDVHFVESKESTQTELLHTLDAIGLDGAHVVLASDEHPSRIESLSAQLASRFISGAVVRLESPDPELRDRLVRELARRRGLPLEDDAVRLLVDRAGRPAGAGASVRDIEGMVTQVDAVRRLAPELAGGGDRLGAGAVRRALGLWEGPARETTSVRRPVRIDAIVDAACAELGVDRGEVLGPGRHRRIVLARSIITRLARELTTMSFPEIARALRRPSHSTVVAADQRIVRQLANEDPGVRAMVDEVRARLNLDRAESSRTS